MESLEQKLIKDDKEKQNIVYKLNEVFKDYGVEILNVINNSFSGFISKIESDDKNIYFYITNQEGTKKVYLPRNNLLQDEIDIFSDLLNSNVSVYVNNGLIKGIKINGLTLDRKFINGNELNILTEEEQRKYKYIHYRQEGIFEAIKERENIIKQIRSYFSENGFIEIETPILGPIFNEYADESFLVEDKKIGGFYSLPQSPQVYKQLSILSGVQKYFQIARCFRRDADTEFKKIEFTQMDVEVANLTSEEIRKILENLIIKLFQTKGIDIGDNIPVFTYEEAIEKFGTEKPILKDRKYSLCWVIQAPIFEMENGKIQPTHHVVSKPLNEDLHLLNIDPLKVRGDNYDLILNGQEVAGGDIRINDTLLQYQMLKIIGYSDEYIQEYYGWYLEALSNGCPPHGGFATGVERIITLLNNDKNISKYIMFPKYAVGEPISGFPKKI